MVKQIMEQQEKQLTAGKEEDFRQQLLFGMINCFMNIALSPKIW